MLRSSIVAAALALVLALVVSMLAAPGAQAQQISCEDPAGSCRIQLDASCMRRFGAGVVAADAADDTTRCANQLHGYRDCLEQVATQCDPGNPTTQQLSAGSVDPTGFWTFTDRGRNKVNPAKLRTPDIMEIGNQIYVRLEDNFWKDEDATGTYEFLNSETAIWNSNHQDGRVIKLVRLYDPTGVWSFTDKGETKRRVFEYDGKSTIRGVDLTLHHAGGNLWKDEASPATYEFYSKNRAIWRSNDGRNQAVDLHRE